MFSKKWILFFLLIAVSPVRAASDLENAIKTMKDMLVITNTAQIFSVMNSGYPSAKNMTEFVKEVEPVTRQIPGRVIPMKDAWGNEFQYRHDAERKHFWIISYGSDGKADSEIYDENGIPKKEDYPPTTDPKSDIIFKDGRFIQRHPKAEGAALDK